MKNLSVINKLKILLFVKVVVGSIITIFFDIIIGVIILIAGAITLFWIVGLINKTDHEINKSIPYLHIILGLLMFLGVIIITVTSVSYRDIKVIVKTIIGCLFMLKGIYELNLKSHYEKKRL